MSQIKGMFRKITKPQDSAVALSDSKSDLNLREEVRDENERLRKRIEELEIELEFKSGELTVLRNGAVNAGTEESLVDRLRVSEQTLLRLETTRKETEERVRRLESNLTAMHREREALTEELIQANKQKTEALIENQRLKAQIDGHVSEKRQYQTRLEEYKKLIETLMNRK